MPERQIVGEQVPIRHLPNSAVLNRAGICGGVSEHTAARKAEDCIQDDAVVTVRQKIDKLKILCKLYIYKIRLL